jgi:hypothetical protein
LVELDGVAAGVCRKTASSLKRHVAPDGAFCFVHGIRRDHLIDKKIGLVIHMQHEIALRLQTASPALRQAIDAMLNAAPKD